MLIVGTGAVATFLLSRLDSTQQLQVFGPPSPRTEALRQRGYKVVSAAAEVAQHQGWIVCTKTTQNLAKVAQLRGAVSPRQILVLQNGLHPEREWTALGKVERGVSTYGVRCSGPGQVQGGRLGDISLPSGSWFATVLRQAGLSVKESSDMDSVVWSKLVVNASLNVVSSILNCPNGELLHSPWGLPRALGAAHEVARLAARQGISLTADPTSLLGTVARDTADNICSTLADLRGGRVTEYDDINGSLLRLAAKLEVAVPYLEELDREFSSLQVPELAS